MRPVAAEAGETRFLSNITKSSLRSLLPAATRSISSFKKRNPDPKLNPKTRKSVAAYSSENIPPPDPNVRIDAYPSPLSLQKPPLQVEIAQPTSQIGVVKDGLDPSVKVVVRIRPLKEHEKDGLGAVTKVSSDSLSVEDRRFTFDSVLDSSSNQEDVFDAVGIPVVKSALAGYNASILSYGQSGSGKSYTMWGPPSAMVEDPAPCSQQGIAPRMFQMLFSEIKGEQENSDWKLVNYQCRCSFLEIYNEEVRDLLEPMQKNLEIVNDPKVGLRVENLTEEYVDSFEDVTQILIKGLSSRKVGATSTNSKRSRSHVIFTLIIESWCKGSSSTCFGSSKISKVSLVDLAGLDRNKVDDANKELAKEGKYVKKSLSHLGLLVNVLSKQNQLGSLGDLPYEESCLTHLMRDSLGGNTKLAVVCSISPGTRNNAETLRTLRFGQRVKSIKNEPVINVISEDDVNDLSDQIRQLKDELIRAKSDVPSAGRENGYYRGKNARESLNQLRVSLNRSLILPRIDNDSDNEVNVGEDDVRELHQQLHKLQNRRGVGRDLSENRDSAHFSSVEENFDMDQMSEGEVDGPEDVSLEKYVECFSSDYDLLGGASEARAVDPALESRISISLSKESAVALEPTLCESPKIGSARKSVAMPSGHQNNVFESTNLKSHMLLEPVKQSERLKSSSLRSSKILAGHTDSLAASLQRGLEIISNHHQNSALNRSSVSFSFGHLAMKPCLEVEIAEDSEFSNRPTSSLCAACHREIVSNSANIHESLKTSKNVSNNSEEDNKRETELENVCKEQAARIEQLQLLVLCPESLLSNSPNSEQLQVEQYKTEREQFSLGPDQGVTSCQNQIILVQESKTKLFETGDTELAKEKCEIKEIQEVLDCESKDMSMNTGFDANEKAALLQEIDQLKTKLKFYTDAAANKPIEKLRSSLLAQSIQLRKSVDTRPSTLEEFEKERQRWTEMESDWISFTDSLRLDLEASRRQTEEVEMELKSEKKCSEELDDALSRSILGHAKMVEHYAELQEKFNDLIGEHRAMMEGVAEIKRAAAKAGTKSGNRFAKAVANELSATRTEKERERGFLRKENKSLKIQLRDTAEAVHAAGELLVRLRESEQTASAAEENRNQLQEENEKLKKQIEKVKRKHKMEMITMKQYMAESKLPESALQSMYHEEDPEVPHSTLPYDDDQAWRAEFGPIYQEHHY